MSNDSAAILDDILKELKRQKKSSFPVHIVARASAIAAPAGMLLNTAGNVKYKRGKADDETNKEMRELAIKTIANGIRFLESLNK